LQQLGRGLRRVDGKPCLTVLDFIGNQRQEFRFDLRYRALTGVARGDLAKAVEDDFPFLPSGCHVELDRVAASVVLENVRRQLRRSTRELARELREMGDVALPTFLQQADAELEDVYPGSRTAAYGWNGLRRAAQFPVAVEGPDEDALAAGVGRLLHVSDTERISTWMDWLTAPRPPDPDALSERERRLLAMLLGVLETKTRRSVDGHAALARLWNHPAILDELASVLEVLEERAAEVPLPLNLPHGADVPLHAHCRYTRLEILAALGRGVFTTTYEWREGVLWNEPHAVDVLAFTLRKAERDFSPTTMYQDYAISRDLVHWESQSTLTQKARTAQRYVNHEAMGTSIVLFARQTKHDRAFLCLGRGHYVEHRGERPLAIVWRLEHSLPEAFFREARAGAA
jgi:hypothetical protein